MPRKWFPLVAVVFLATPATLWSQEPATQRPAASPAVSSAPAAPASLDLDHLFNPKGKSFGRTTQAGEARIGQLRAAAGRAS